MVYILVFSNSRELIDIKNRYDNLGNTSLEALLDDFSNGYTSWSVPKKAVTGDIVVFYCAKEARKNLGLATSHIPSDYSQEFRTFVEKQKGLYKKFSGYILGYGVVSSLPEYDDYDNRWYADINQLQQFPTPIHYEDFKNYIFIIRGSSVTGINENQWKIIQWLVNQNNPGFFNNASMPDDDILNHEFENMVKKEVSKPLDQLKKKAEKSSSMPSISNVQTKVYNRDPVIAAYVKKRANGFCQLCGQKAPFNDKNGEPYLECHHIEWLSSGGMDSTENCVALCPNCHRRMHIINDLNDKTKLKSIATES